MDDASTKLDVGSPFWEGGLIYFKTAACHLNYLASVIYLFYLHVRYKPCILKLRMLMAILTNYIYVIMLLISGNSFILETYSVG